MTFEVTLGNFNIMPSKKGTTARGLLDDGALGRKIVCPAGAVVRLSAAGKPTGIR